MKTYLDCVPCFFKQALAAAKIAGLTTKKQRELLNELGQNLAKFSQASSPPEMGRIIYGLVNKFSLQEDIYLSLKEKSNKLALSIYSKLKNKVSHSHDRLLKAVELSIAGNIIDYGAKHSLNIDEEVKRILQDEDKKIKQEKKKEFNYKKFKDTLDSSKTILFLLDNAGEIVFDRILIEEIKRRDKDKKIICALRDKPVINDALIADAYTCGLDKHAEIISSGSDAPGTVLSLCSKEFLSIFKKADMVISKGQGNFEALSTVKRSVFFLFMVKCQVLAKEIEGNMGDVILKYHSSSDIS